MTSISASISIDTAAISLLIIWLSEVKDRTKAIALLCLLLLILMGGRETASPIEEGSRRILEEVTKEVVAKDNR